jgi:type IV secretory pathway TrbD component
MVASIMLVPIGYDKEVAKVQVEPVVETEEVIEITTLGTMVITGILTGEAHLTVGTALIGISLSFVSGLCAWAVGIFVVRWCTLRDPAQGGLSSYSK